MSSLLDDLVTTEHNNPGSKSADQTRLLVTRLREGNSEAAILLDQLYREALIRFCWGYLGSTEEAEDAVQDICYKVLTMNTVPDRFRPWLYKIARNYSLNIIRDRANQKEGNSEKHVSQIHDVLTGHLTRMVHEEQQQHMTELVDTLSDTHREVLRLRYVEELSRPEIAEVLDLSEQLVKSRLFEGLKKLRDYSSLLES